MIEKILSGLRNQKKETKKIAFFLTHYRLSLHDKL